MFLKLWNRLLAWLRHRDLDCEVQDELAFHLEMQTLANIERGMLPDQARREARIALGGVDQTREAVRDSRWTWLDSTWRDMPAFIRRLVRQPQYLYVAVLALSVGFAATTAVFSVVDAVLFRPLAYPYAGRLVAVRERNPSTGQVGATLSVQDVLTISANAESVEEVGGFGFGSNWLVSLQNGAPKIVEEVDASVGALRSLGIDNLPSDGSLMITHRFCAAYFGTCDSFPRTPVRAKDKEFMIGAVLPSWFAFPSYGPVRSPDVVSVLDLRAAPPYARVFAIARLRPNTTLERAQSEIARLLSERDMSPAAQRPDVLLVPLHQALTGLVRPSAWLLLSGASLIAVVACVNAGQLLLARAYSRSAEFAVRTALGAPGRALVGHVLGESVTISGAACLIGLGMAGVVLRGSRPWLPYSYTRLHQPALDGRVVLACVGLSLLTAAAISYVPAVFSRRCVWADLRTTAGAVVRAPWRKRSVRALIACQSAIGTFALSLAICFAVSFSHARFSGLGFEPIGVQVLTPRLAADRYRDQAAVNAYFGRAIEILAATPNVQAVGAVDMVPFGGSVNKLLFAAPEGRAIRLETRFVAGDYFRAMDFQMLSGRSLDGARLSTDARVAVLTQNAARALFGTAGSIGRTLLSEDFGDLDVVGVVNDIRNGPELTPDLGVFLPASAVSPLRRIVARVSGKSTGVDELIRGLTLIDPTTIVSGGRLLNEVSSLLVTQRLQAVVLGAAAAAVLLLVASGIYAVVAFCAETSRRETAVRLALGARPATLRLRYVTLALQGGLLGAVVGLGAAAATLALLDHVLYGAPQANVLLYVGSALACVALAGATAAAAVWKCTVEQGLQALLRD